MPFDSIIGMRDAKDALRLLAAEPRLKGVLLGAGPGTGKSTLARAFGAEMGSLVEIPTGVTPDRLLGGLDLEGALRGDAPCVEPGLMARADGGVVYVDNAHLLEPWAAQQIAECLNSGRVCLEREGFSAQLSARFLLVATFDPQAGQVHAALRDAVGLHVSENAPPSVAQRVAVMKGTTDVSSPFRVVRERMRCVEMAPEDKRRMVSAAVALGVEGHRGDSFAILAARASAALDGRVQVDEEDVQTAMRLVLYPRAGMPRAGQGAAPREVEGDTTPQTDDGELTTVAAAAASVPEELIDTAPVISRARGRPVRAASAGERIAFAATVRAAAPLQRVRPSGPMAINVTADDLRFRRLREKASTLVVFALDASGSMAASRLHQVKGAIIHLLQTAYLRRAQVALVSFRGHEARVLIEPTRSVALAKRAVDALPAGGGTPMAAGLEAALRIATAQRYTGCSALLVLLTDGRANVARTGAVQEDLSMICRSVREHEMASVVIDTASRFVATGDADRIARMLSARYFHLPRADARGIANAVGEEIVRMNL